MAIEIQPYAAEREPAVREFNRRLKAGGCPFHFPESAHPTWLPRENDEPIYEEYLVAGEGAAVRGGYVLKRQPFWSSGKLTEVGCVSLPLSEGAVDAKYNGVALQLLMNALKKQPRLFSLGMGGFHQPYPRLLKAAGWSLCAVPFYFRVLNPNVFLKNFTLLRRRKPARILLDALAVTGLGWLGIKSANVLLKLRAAPDKGVAAQLVAEFAEWADLLWEQGRAGYALVAVRVARSLNRLYPRHKEKFLKLKVSRAGTPVGWAAMLDTRMTAHKQFGQMRVGSVIDCFAAPGEESAVAQCAVRFLEKRGVDIIVSNQSHAAWRAAFARAGCWRGPSNFIFAGSPKLAADIAPFAEKQSLIHFNRGDGEGPSHL